MSALPPTRKQACFMEVKAIRKKHAKWLRWFVSEIEIESMKFAMARTKMVDTAGRVCRNLKSAKTWKKTEADGSRYTAKEVIWHLKYLKLEMLSESYVRSIIKLLKDAKTSKSALRGTYGWLSHNPRFTREGIMNQKWKSLQKSKDFQNTKM